MMRLSIPLVVLCTGTAALLGAQDPATTRSNYEDRARLEEQAIAAESAQRTSEAQLLRSRLKNGDFKEGDRIVVILESNPSAIDTMQVRAGKMLLFPRMAEVSLDGVLRSELADRLRQHLSTFLTNPGVRAMPLLPLAVLGSVRNPGFIYAPPDYVLRDVITRAGGLNPDADLNMAIVRRGGLTIWDVVQVRLALTEGLSLDRLHLRAGDEVFVPQRRRFQMSTVVTLLSTTAAVSVAILQMRSR